MAEDNVEDLGGSNKDNGGTGGNGGNITPAMLTTEPPMTSGDQDEKLLPGVPNHITLDKVCPKLSWRDFYVLAQTSRDWKNAIRGHLVYEARVRTRSTETLAVFAFVPSWESIQKISLYSMRNESWYELPPIPGLPFAFPFDYHCVSLDGKIYVLGGNEKVSGYLEGDTNMYVLDLAGQGQWKKCANMQVPRVNCSLGASAGVLDGKIYVFGMGDTLESEVYDPKVDAWSMIAPMVFRRSIYQVVAMGEEILVNGGVVNLPDDVGKPGLFFQAYHPMRDEWRLIQPFGINTSEAVFIAQGKLHVLTDLGIYVHDIDEGSRTLLQRCSFREYGPVGSTTLVPLEALAMDDELLIVLLLKYGDYERLEWRLLRSRGFGDMNKVIVWEPVKCSCRSEDCVGCYKSYFMCSIQL